MLHLRALPEIPLPNSHNSYPKPTDIDGDSASGFVLLIIASAYPVYSREESNDEGWTVDSGGCRGDGEEDQREYQLEDATDMLFELFIGDTSQSRL